MLSYQWRLGLESDAAFTIKEHFLASPGAGQSLTEVTYGAYMSIAICDPLLENRASGNVRFAHAYFNRMLYYGNECIGLPLCNLRF